MIPGRRYFQKSDRYHHSSREGKRCFGFIIEMVLGITHRARERSYYETWYQDLRQATPMFRHDTWLMNSQDYVPQHRPRLYTVGVLCELLGGDAGIPPPMPRASMRALLADCFHKGLRPVDEGMLTPHQINHVSATKPLLQARLMQRAPQLNTLTRVFLGRFQAPIACFVCGQGRRKHV
jgi:site-specific DNA-cytosine methylase